MPSMQGVPSARSDLASWIEEAEGVLDDLDTCSIIVRSMLVGSASSNLVVMGVLDALTRDAEFWLLTNPCPVDGVDSALSEVARFFTAFGQLVLTCRGDSEAADNGTLAEGVQSACSMLEDFKSMTATCTRGAIGEWSG